MKAFIGHTQRFKVARPSVLPVVAESVHIGKITILAGSEGAIDGSNVDILALLEKQVRGQTPQIHGV
jgi:hypothetical protein